MVRAAANQASASQMNKDVTKALGGFDFGRRRLLSNSVVHGATSLSLGTEAGATGITAAATGVRVQPSDRAPTTEKSTGPRLLQDLATNGVCVYLVSHPISGGLLAHATVVPPCTGPNNGRDEFCNGNGECTVVDEEAQCTCDPTFFGSKCETDSPFVGSTLMTEEMQQHVKAWLAEDGQGSAAGWALCYDSPGGDSKSSPSTFHAQCDAHTRTLSVAHTDGNGGRTFGGYAEHSWNAVSGHDETATGDFLFQLAPAAAKYPPMTRNYQYDDPVRWPVWGDGGCLAMGYGGEALGANGFCCPGSSCNGSGCPGLPDDFCGGDGNWGETELEVWYALA